MENETGQTPEKSKKKPKKLNKRQKTFAYEYVKTGNATQSAIKAGYSKASAQPIGARLLLNVIIKAEIDRLQAINAKNLEIEHGVSMKEIRDRLVKIGFSDIKDYLDINEDTVKFKQITPEMNTLGIKTVRRTRKSAAGGDFDSDEDTISVSLDDRVKALQLLGECVGMFEDKKDENGIAENQRLVEERVLKLSEDFEEPGN